MNGPSAFGSRSFSNQATNASIDRRRRRLRPPSRSVLQLRVLQIGKRQAQVAGQHRRGALQHAHAALGHHPRRVGDVGSARRRAAPARLSAWRRCGPPAPPPAPTPSSSGCGRRRRWPTRRSSGSSASSCWCRARAARRRGAPRRCGDRRAGRAGGRRARCRRGALFMPRHIAISDGDRRRAEVLERSVGLMQPVAGGNRRVMRGELVEELVHERGERRRRVGGRRRRRRRGLAGGHG